MKLIYKSNVGEDNAIFFNADKSQIFEIMSNLSFDKCDQVYQ